jgi:hypothetical protein
MLEIVSALLREGRGGELGFAMALEESRAVGFAEECDVSSRLVTRFLSHVIGDEELIHGGLELLAQSVASQVRRQVAQEYLHAADADVRRTAELELGSDEVTRSGFAVRNSGLC